MEDLSRGQDAEDVVCDTEPSADIMEDGDPGDFRMEELLRVTLRALRHDDYSDDEGEGGDEQGAAVRPPRPPERTTPVVCPDPLCESDEDIADSDRCDDSEGDSDGASPEPRAASPRDVCAVPLAEQLAEASRRYLIHHATRSTAPKSPEPAPQPVPPAPRPAALTTPTTPTAPTAPTAPVCDAAAVWALCTMPLPEHCAPPAPRLPPSLTAGPSRRAVASLLSTHAAQQAALLKTRSKELAKHRRHSGSDCGDCDGSGALPPPDVVTTQVVFFARWHALCRRQQTELVARCTALLARQHDADAQRAAAAHDKAAAGARRALVREYARRHDDPAKVLAAFDERALGERAAAVAQVRARHEAEAAQLAADAAACEAQTAAHFAALRAALEAAM